MNPPRVVGAATLALLLVMSEAHPVLADPADIAVRLAELRERQQAMEVELDVRSKEVSQLEQSVVGARLALEQARSRQVELQEDLGEARRELAAARSRLEARVQELYVNGQQRSVTLLLSLTSFDRLDRAVAYLSQVATSDAQLVTELKAARRKVGELAEEASQVVEAAEAGRREAEAAHQIARASYQTTRTESELLDQRIGRLAEAWSEYRLALAQQLVSESGASGSLGAETIAQAERRASLPLGPTQGVPPGLEATGEILRGLASWYGPGFHGRRTSSGAIFDERDYTAAHKTLAFGTLLLVSYRGLQVVVMVNDRGPFIPGRQFDLSRAAAQHLGLGLGLVTAESLVPAG